VLLKKIVAATEIPKNLYCTLHGATWPPSTSPHLVFRFWQLFE